LFQEQQIKNQTMISLLNNTCNDDIPVDNVKVNATDLVGESTKTYSVLASAFKSSGNDGTVCAGGTSLVNNTATGLTGAILPAGNNSINAGDETSGQEQLYYCIPTVSGSLISQIYSTKEYGSWKIQI